MWWVLRSVIFTFAHRTPPRSCYKHAAGTQACGNARRRTALRAVRVSASISRIPACERGFCGKCSPDTLSWRRAESSAKTFAQ